MATNRTETTPARAPGYWPMAMWYAVGFYIVTLLITPALDSLWGDPVDWARTAKRQVPTALFFGLVMAWWSRRRVRRI